MNRIYLDYNASAAIDPRVLKVLVEELEEEKGNPSSIHFHGQLCRKKLEQSRQSIAQFFHVKPQEVFFTSGGTEGAALLLHGVLQKRQGHVISSSAEHICVYQTLKEFEKKGTEVAFLLTGIYGALLAEAVERSIRPDTQLITLMAGNNETGVLTDIEAIAAVAHRANIPFIVDGVGLLGKESFRHIPPGVSALFFSGHKIHAPKGIGFCICRQNLKLAPLFFGGGQEFNRRPGTENLPGIAALAEAISLLEEGQEGMISHMRKMRDRLERGLLSSLPNVVVNGSGPRMSNTVNLSFLGMDGETLLLNLDMEGISVSHGSACSSGALEPSRILLAMGIPLSQARSALRFSVGRTTTEAEIDQALKIIIQVVNRLRK